MPALPDTNLLYFGDNLEILRHHVPDESVDLIYLDPPFNSKQDYNVLFADSAGSKSHAQIEAFSDTWHWDVVAQETYEELVTEGPRTLATAVGALRQFIGSNDVMAYLVMMASRLQELHRVLKPTGSLYLHCDPTASHYLKIVLDTIFGPKRFLNEVTWKRTTAHNDPQRYGRIQDRLLYYSKSAEKTFNRIGGTHSEEQLSRYKYEDEGGSFRAENLTAPHFSPTRTVEWRGVHPGGNRQWRFSTEELERLYQEGRILLQRDGRPRKDGYKVYLVEAEAPALQDIWTDIGLGPTAGERLGYPTQKPLALLERIVQVSSNEGDLVLDPFCGCGTTIAAAEKHRRRWIGIDITNLAISLIEYRLRDMFPGAKWETHGEPADLDGARALAEQDRHQFEWWALLLVDAKPAQDERKKGADEGIDGLIHFLDEAGGKVKTVIVQVKSGHVNASMIRDLKGVMEREKAEMGMFVSLEKPTSAMQKEAVTAGHYYSEGWGQKYPAIQLLTVEELLDGKKPELPPERRTFKQAPKASAPAHESLKLDV